MPSTPVSTLAYPIPNRLNVALVIGVFIMAVVLLMLASYTTSILVQIMIGVIYSYLMLTNYSLLHEAAHEKLNSRKRINYCLGLLPAILFPASLTLIMQSHAKHHQQNRSDIELFDYYYPHNNRALKFIQWYSILIGVFWFYPPLGTIIFSVIPYHRINQWFKNTTTVSAYCQNYKHADISAIRIEFLITMLFYFVLFSVFKVELTALLICYGFTAVNWSTRQFIEHAFTQRDLIEGSLNLHHFSWMSTILLHRELDLNHHRQPAIPWIYLPRLTRPEDQRISYLRQYFDLWRGPKSIQYLPASS